MSREPHTTDELGLYRSLFELATVGIMHISPAGRVIWTNDALCRILAYEPGELAGLEHERILHPEDVEVSRARIEDLYHGRIIRSTADRRFRRKDGQYLWVNVTSSAARDEKGRPLHVIGLMQDISERKRQELELRQSEQRLNAIFEAVQDVVWSFSATEYRLLFLNASATERLYGRHADDFFSDPDLWMEVVHADDRNLVGSIWGRLVESGFTEDHYRIVRANGQVRWVQARAWTTIGEDGKPARFEGVVRDVTESRNAELALRDSEEKLRILMESGQMGTWELDTKTGDVTWSKVLRNILGVSEDQAPSTEYYYSMIHPEDLERHRRDALALERGRSGFAPFRIRRPDGKVRWLQNIGKVVRLGENGSKLMGVLVDVTEARELEHTVEAQRQQMEAASKMSALGVMAGGMAHEINNPVAIIHGNATLLEQMAERGEVAPGQMKQAAKVIAQTAERISKITRSLLAFARDSGSDPVRCVPVRSVVEETAELCRQRFRGHGVDFEIEWPDPSLELECRPVQISQVLLNLLNNAHDAVGDHGERWIRISAADGGENVEIYVTDSGPGIPGELREKIFQPFFTTKDVGKGTGLGLSVASGIVEAHGGTLKLDPRSPRTRFVVQLPKRQRR